MTYDKVQNEERRISPISESCVDSDMVASETKLAVAELLKKRLLPRTTYDLYVESDKNVRLCLPLIINALWNDRTFKYIGDGSWCMGVGNGQEKTPLQKAMMIGPVWEPMLAERLRLEGLPIEQQRHECGYYLDIALVDGESKLDVEVDGRQHKILPSQRAKDIVRDYRLKANGWSVLRIEVADIIANTSNCIERVKNTWNNLKEGDSI